MQLFAAEINYIEPALARDAPAFQLEVGSSARPVIPETPCGPLFVRRKQMHLVDSIVCFGPNQLSPSHSLRLFLPALGKSTQSDQAKQGPHLGIERI